MLKLTQENSWGENVVISKKSSDNNKINDRNSLILMLGILNGKLDEIIRLLSELNKKAKKPTNSTKTAFEQIKVNE